MHFGRSNVTIVCPNAPPMHPGRSNVTIVMPNAPRTLKRHESKSRHVSCPDIFWFESEANRDPVFRDQKMVPDVWNGSLLQLVSLTIWMCWNSLLKLELWSHRGAFGSIAWCLFSECIFHFMARKVSVAITLLVMYPYGSTIKCNKILFGVMCWDNKGFVVDTFAECSSPLIQIRVSWISSSSQLPEMQYV